MMSNICVRFAPSPTGFLHLGNARTAILNFLLARHHGGRFLLRIDDTDPARSRDEYADAIVEDLAWLGIVHDETFRQSSRLAAYQEAAERLKASGYLYPCYESEQELARARSAARAAGHPPIYDRAALKLTPAQKQALQDEGRKPHWRFKLSGEVCRFDDWLHKRTEIQTASLSDPVLIRGDGRFLYTLPSVLDDLDFQTSHVIRGEDHLTNTATHIEIAKALGGTPPVFAHHPLMFGADGARLSKRDQGKLTLRSLRGEGFEPEAVLLFLIGCEEFSDDLIKNFDFFHASAARIRFDREYLERLNRHFIQTLGWAQAEPRLLKTGIAADAHFWETIRGNLTKFTDAQAWWDVLHGIFTPVVEDEAFLAQARHFLPAEPWDEQTWPLWTKKLSEASARRGRDLFLPLRLALTAKPDGPEMKKLILLLGYERVMSRLQGKSFTPS